MYSGLELTALYATNHLLASTEELHAVCQAHMQALGGEVWRIDAGYKNAGKIHTADGHRAMEATVTVMNESNQVVGLYHGSGELLPLEKAFVRLDQRNKALGKNVELVYVDNSQQTSRLLERCFPDMPPDGGVKEDLFHVIQRVGDSLPDGHSLKGAFMRELSTAMKVWDKDDFEQQRLQGLEPTEKMCCVLVDSCRPNSRTCSTRSCVPRSHPTYPKAQ
ncbi:hypothetical protein PLESTB_000567600 [Pleodorina starrii]|uniref:Uncharacterized protein n=1 Tax=Pleodorina starrii TaxID=330485 RepID=A0A9W6F1A4_9CHLO|nr:hypothetical protein PLESTM_000316900 [Pleodorina starrii]GLC51961.1 hypothetical protein PLESTB_000567600 [Pleodorina starrii]GLC68539.1 hypothetical protein PLESTF_000703500 [Pleodorina starrii]